MPHWSPPNGCLCVVLVADLHVGGARGGDLQPAVPLSGRLTGLVTGPTPCLCVPGDSAVWPPAQRAAETVSAALPVLQPPAPHQSAVPLPHLGLLQQLPKQGDPAAGDELCAAGYIHSGKHQKTIIHTVYVCSYRCNVTKLISDKKKKKKYPSPSKKCL